MTLSSHEYFWIGAGLGWAACGICFWVFSRLRYMPEIPALNDDTLLKLAREVKREVQYRFPSEFPSPVRLPTDTQ
jgi:hypothetical protein